MNRTEMCLQNYIDDYGMKLEGSTLASYQIAIRQLFNYCDKEFDEITSKDIRQWMNFLKEKDYKPATLQGKYTGVNMFFSYCLEEGLITRNPVDPIAYPTLDDSFPYYLEMSKLIELRQIVQGDLEERAMVEVFYATGVRLSEFIAIQKEDINWSERSILIPKGKYSRSRIVLFTRLCAEYLQSYLKERNDTLPFLFLNKTGIGPINKLIILYRFKRYREELGFYLSPHKLRHTFAAHLAQKGMPLEGIQALLGHEKPKNTKIYARLYDQARKDKYDEWM